MDLTQQSRESAAVGCVVTRVNDFFFTWFHQCFIVLLLDAFWNMLVRILLGKLLNSRSLNIAGVGS